MLTEVVTLKRVLEVRFYLLSMITDLVSILGDVLFIIYGLVFRMHHPVVIHTVLYLSLCASAIFIPVSPLQAQVRLAAPNIPIDLAKYSTFEECMALKKRLNARAKRNLPYWKDSLEYSNSDKLHTLPNPVRDTLTLCMSKFSPANVDYNNYTEYLDWITVFYDVGRAKDAEVVINKKLSMAKWDRDDTSGRHKVITTIVSALELARPIPWDAIVGIAKTFESSDVSSPWEAKINVYGTLLRLSDEFNDTSVRRYATDKALALEKSLSDDDRAGYEWQSLGRYTLLQALDYMHHNEMFDSLRIGPQAYLSFRNSYWRKVRGENTDKLPSNVGEIAKPIVADFWFKRAGDSVVCLTQAPGSFPRAGDINLIVFLEIRCAASTPTFLGQYHRSFPVSSSCLPSYSVIRRLAERYPSLRVTIVSMTDGFIGLAEPMTPEQEATHKSQWWLGTFKLPATLAVAEQKFFKLPAPDGRRIDEVHENTTNYLFNLRETRVPTGTAFLTDIDGTILYSSEINPKTERQFNQLLKVITNRKL